MPSQLKLAYKRDTYLEEVVKEMSEFQTKCTDYTGQSFDKPERSTQQLEYSFTLYLLIEGKRPLPPSVELIMKVQRTIIYIQSLCKIVTDKVHREKKDRLSALDDLKGKLESLLLFLERVVSAYICNNGGKENLKLDELHRLKKQVLDIIRTLNLTNLEHVCDDQEAISCAYLGLKDAVRRSLPKDDFSLSHQSLLYWIYSFMENQYLNLPQLLSERPELPLAKQFQWLGFTDSRSRVLADWADGNNSFHHRNLLYWAQQYVEMENALFLGIFQEIPFVFHPKDPSVDESSFQQNVQLGYADDETDKHVPITCSNVYIERMSDISSQVDELLANHNDQPNTTLWYHVTGCIHAKDITQNGIKLGKGKPHCDFSDGYGFYLALDYNFALGFVRNKIGKDALCLLVFSVTNGFIDKYKERSIDLNDNGELHRKTIAFYKTEKGREPKGFKNFNYLEGPTSGYDGGNRESSQYHQICIKQQDMADDLNNFLSHAFSFDTRN